MSIAVERMSIAVVIATKDRGSAVIDAAESVLASQRDFDLIVIDQSAGNSTETAVGSIADERLTYIRSTGRGLSNGRNEAIRGSRADLVLITDDDCVPPPEWVDVMTRTFDDPSVGVVFCSVAAAPTDEVGHTPAVVFERTTTLRTVGAAWRAGRRGLPLGAGMALRRAVWEEVAGFDPLLGAGARFGSCEDSDLSWRALRAGWATVHSAEVTVVHHGFRTLAEVRELVVRDFFGVGGAIAKYLRVPGLRRSAAGFGLSWLFHFGVRLPMRQLLAGDRPSGFRRPLMLVRGVIDGLRTSLDPEHVVYRPSGVGRRR